MSHNKLLLLIFSLLLFFQDKIFSKFNCSTQASTVNLLGANSSLAVNLAMTGFSGTMNVKDNSSATITGTSMAFVGGIFNTGNVSSVFTGFVDPTTTDKLVLYNGNSIDVKSGQIVQSVTIASSSTATILGQPRFASSITITDTSSVLQLGITTNLSQNILGTGKVKLLNDLTTLTSIDLPSLIDLNSYRLEMFGGTYSTAKTISGGGTIEILGQLTLTGQWTIGSGSENYTIAGHGNVLDLNQAGTILFNGGILTLENLVVKGLSTGFLRGSGEIKMSNVTLDLAGNYTRSDGKLTIVGSNCKIITNGYTFIQSGSGNDLKIDGVFLFYEQLNSAVQTTPISVASSAVITKLNGGDIQSVGGSSSSGVGGVEMTVSVASSTLDRSYFISSSSPFQVNNANPGTPFPVSINGGGSFLSMPQQSGSYLILQNNVQLNLNNIVIKDFYPSAISLGTSSSITFGDNTRIELGQDLTIGATDMSWTFTGNAEIDGNSATVTVNKTSGITVTGSKTLTLKNMTLVAGTDDCLKSLSDSGRIKLQDVTFVVQNAGYTFSVGYLDITGITKITGGAGGLFSRVNFEFASKGNLTIGTNAELIVDPNINLKYNANPGTDLLTYNSKRHLLFSTYTSQLTLNGCSLECTATGLSLDNGTMKVIDKVTITSTTNSGSEFEIGKQLNVNLSSGAVIDLAGPVRYQE